MAALKPPIIVLLLNGRGQLIYSKDDESHRPIEMEQFENVKYASCANFGVCAMGQRPGTTEIIIDHYSNEETMNSSFLKQLGDDYKQFHAQHIAQRHSHPSLIEFVYQQDGFWTEKPFMYEKYIRFYPRNQAYTPTSGFTLVSMVVNDGDVQEFRLDDLDWTQRIKLSDIIKSVKKRFPTSRIEIYDSGCLKLLSDATIGNEPDQDSRIPPTSGGRRKNTKFRKRNRKTTRRKH
jgi:hypothetical protein